MTSTVVVFLGMWLMVCLGLTGLWVSVCMWHARGRADADAAMDRELRDLIDQYDR